MPQQEFSRISLHMHGVGGAGGGTPINLSSLTYIDSGNISNRNHGDFASRIRFDYPFSVSSNVVDIFYGDSGVPAEYEYSVKSSTSAPHFLYLRVSPYAVLDSISFTIRCGRSNFSTQTITFQELQNAGNPSWIWIPLQWLPTDLGNQSISIMMQGRGFVLDVVAVSQSDLLLSPVVQQAIIFSNPAQKFFVVSETFIHPLQRETIIPQLSASYTTLHLKIFEVNQDGSVSGEYPLSGYSSDLGPYAEDGWINFDIEPIPAFGSPSVPGRFGISVSQSPISDQRYFIWDEEATSSVGFNSSTVVFDFSSTSQVSSRLATRVFVKNEQSPDCLLTSTAERNLIRIDNFASQAINPSFSNTQSTSEGLALDLPERTVAVVLDESGSMSWNDASNVRHQIASDVLSTLQQAYPGAINVVVSTFQGEPIKVEWFAATEEDISLPSNALRAKSESNRDLGTDFAGVQVVRRFDRYPTSPTDGDIVASGMLEEYIGSSDVEAERSYFGLFPFDSHGVFGDARYLSVPHVSARSDGIKSFVGEELVGTGLPRSSDAMLLLHMNEGSGFRLYDFSNFGNHADVIFGSNPPRWVDTVDAPPLLAGDKKDTALRLSGLGQYILTSSAVGSTSDALTIAAWVYGFPTTNTHTLISCEISSTSLVITWNGNSLVATWGAATVTIPLVAEQWHRIAWSISSSLSSVTLHVDDSSSTIAHTFGSAISVGRLSIGGARGAARNWFGRISEVSVHALYISEAEQAALSDGVKKDNGDRALRLKWFVNPAIVGTDGKCRVMIRRTKERGHLRVLNQDIAGAANVGSYTAPVDWRPPGTPPGFAGTPTSDLRVRMAMGDDLGPCSVEEGDFIFDSNLAAGEHELFFIEDFDSPLTTGTTGQRGKLTWECMRHFFRIFSSKNADSDDFAPPEDSGLFQYTPRIILPPERPSFTPPSVDNLRAVASANKVRLDWTPPSSSDVSTIIVYYRKSGFPQVEGDPIPGETPSDDSYPIFIGDASSNYCVLRKGRIAIAERPGSSFTDIAQGLSIGDVIADEMESGKPAYFHVYTRDRFGNLSEPGVIQVTIPKAESPITTGPEAVMALRYENTSSEQFVVRWFNPLLPRRFFDVRPWFDEKLFIYLRVTDRLGSPIDNQAGLELDTDYVVSSSDPEANFAQLPGFCFVGDNRYTFDAITRRAQVQLFRFQDVVEINKVELSEGWWRFDVRIAPMAPERLACLEAVYFAAKASLTIRQNPSSVSASVSPGRTFSFVTQPIRVGFYNPLAVELGVNASDHVEYSCNRFVLQGGTAGSSICSYADGSNPVSEFVGAYAGRRLPIAFTVNATYRGSALPPGSVATISSFEDELPSFSASRFSQNVQEGCAPPQGYKFEGIAAQIDVPQRFLFDFVDLANAEIANATYTDALLLRPSSPVATFSDVQVPSFAGCLYNNTCGGYASQAIFYVPVPEIPAAARIAATVSVGGFRRSSNTYVVSAPTVKIDLQSSPPIADGRTVAQQRALVYFIDPDVSQAGSLSIRPVADGTPVRWELLGFRNSTTRPFYSTAVSSDPRFSSGVWDFTVGGRSDRVFFGPVSNIRTSVVTSSDAGSSGDNNINGGGSGDVEVVPEEYILKVTVAIGVQSVSVQASACLVPLASQAYEQEVDNSENAVLAKTAIYADAPYQTTGYPNVQTIYADGLDSAIFRVVRDVRVMPEENKTTNTLSFINCYIDDGTGSGSLPDSVYVPLADVNSVDIDVERTFKFGSQNSQTGLIPYWNYPVNVLINGVTFIDRVSADDRIALQLSEGNETYFNVSTNGFVPLKWSEFGEPTTARGTGFVCDSFEIPGWTGLPSGNAQNPGNWVDFDFAVNIEGDLFADSEFSRVYSKGNYNQGNPGKMIKLKEPLSIRFAYLEKNGVRTAQTFIEADGQAAFSLIFVVTFSNKPVPDGTSVRVGVCGTNSLGIADGVLSTSTVNETGGWYEPSADGSVPQQSSIVRVALPPIPQGNPIDFTIFAECNYDRSTIDPVYRQRVHGVRVRYTGQQMSSFGAGGSGSGGGGDSGTGGVVFSDLDISSLPIIDDGGGLPGRISAGWDIPASAECYLRNLSSAANSSSWVRAADFGFKKAWHGLAAINGGFLSFGGLTQQGSTNYTEFFDVGNNMWVGKSKMPTPLFGMTVINDGRYIYAIGGVEFKKTNSSVSTPTGRPIASSRIFRYDYVSDSWVDLEQMPPISVTGPVIGGFGGGSSGSTIFERHGVAYATGQLIDKYIIIIGGASAFSRTTGEISEFSKFVHIFDIENLTWVGSFEVPEAQVFSLSRINASSFLIGDNKIGIFSGSTIRETDVEYSFGNMETIITVGETDKVYYVSTVKLDFSSLVNGAWNPDSNDLPFTISSAEDIIPDHPTPRDGHATLIYGDRMYVVGGTIPPLDGSFGTNASKKVEILIRRASGDFERSQDLSMPAGKSMLVGAVNSDGLAMVAGGVTTGRAPGFCQMSLEAFGEQTESNQQSTAAGFRLENVDALARLDGKSGVDIRVKVYDDEGDLLQGTVEVEVEGFIKFQGSDTEEFGSSVGGFTNPGTGPARIFRQRRRKGTKIFPVRLDPRRVSVIDGIGYTRVSPRTEDPFMTISEIQAILDQNFDSDGGLPGAGSGGRNQEENLLLNVRLRSGRTRFPYQIIVAGRIIDDLYYGSTEFDPNKENQDVTERVPVMPVGIPDRGAGLDRLEGAQQLPPFTVRGVTDPLNLIDGIPFEYTPEGSDQRLEGELVWCTTASGTINSPGDWDVFTFVSPADTWMLVQVLATGATRGERRTPTVRTRVQIYDEAGNKLVWPIITLSNRRATDRYLQSVAPNSPLPLRFERQEGETEIYAYAYNTGGYFWAGYNGHPCGIFPYYFRPHYEILFDWMGDTRFFSWNWLFDEPQNVVLPESIASAGLPPLPPGREQRARGFRGDFPYFYFEKGKKYYIAISDYPTVAEDPHGMISDYLFGSLNGYARYLWSYTTGDRNATGDTTGFDGNDNEGSIGDCTTAIDSSGNIHEWLRGLEDNRCLEKIIKWRRCGPPADFRTRNEQAWIALGVDPNFVDDLVACDELTQTQDQNFCVSERIIESWVFEAEYYRTGPYRLYIGLNPQDIPNAVLFPGGTPTQFPIVCNEEIDYENLEICWDQMVPVSFFQSNGLDAPVEGREVIDGCEMAPYTVCVKPCSLSLTDPKSVVGAASNSFNWKLLTRNPYPCGVMSDPPVGGGVCNTEWPSPDCSKTVGEYAPDLCNQNVDGENMLKWAWAPWSPLWMCKSELCSKCPNLCNLKNWPDFTKLQCLDGCQDPVKCNTNPENRRIDFTCGDRYWTTYLGFNLNTRSVFGQLAYGPDGNKVPVELNAAYPGFDPAAVQQAQQNPSLQNFSHYLNASLLPRLRRNFRFNIRCLSSGALFTFSATSKEGQNAYAGSGGDGQCPFTCPQCQSSTDNPYSGLECTGSDNTTCSTINVISAPLNLKSSFTGVSSSSSSSSWNGEGTIILPPSQPAQVDPDALQFDLIPDAARIVSSQIPTFDLPLNPIVQYYSDIDWIPSVRTYSFEGDNAISQAMQKIEIIGENLPFGCSPMFDGIVEAIRASDSVTDPDGSMASVVITDADENLSVKNAVEVVDESISLRGRGKAPVAFINISTAYPVTASQQANLADQGDQSYIISETEGLTYQVGTDSAAADAARSAINLLRGLAAGKYSAVINFGEEITLESIVLDASEDAIVSVMIRKSDDGKIFEQDGISASPAAPWLGARRGVIFKIDVSIAQQFPELGATLIPAVLRSIAITYARASETLIVSKPISLPSSPHQVVGVVDANIREGTEVGFSAAAHTYTSWNRFDTDVTPAADGGGRVIVPIRSRDGTRTFVEKLIRTSDYTYTAQLGPWQRGSTVVVRIADVVQDASQYRENPDNGTIVFSRPQATTEATIEITAASEAVFAFNFTNRSSEHNVCINSLVVDVLESPYRRPEQNSLPEAIDLGFVINEINLYSPVELRYLFIDPDGDQEDQDKTVIRWYRNGVELPILRNQRRFNDLYDAEDPLYTLQYWSVDYRAQSDAEGIPAEIIAATRAESFLYTNDELFFEVTPHDGKSAGAKRRSPVIRVAAPLNRPTQLRILPRLETTDADTSSLSNIAYAFADLEFFNPEQMLNSKIQWRYFPAGANPGDGFINITDQRPLNGGGSFGGSGVNAIKLRKEELVRNVQGVQITGFPVGSRVFAALIFGDNTSILSNELVSVNVPPQVESARWSGFRDLASGSFRLNFSAVVRDVDVSLNQQNQQISYSATFEKRLQSGDFVPMVPQPLREAGGNYVLYSYADGSGDIDCAEDFTIRATVVPFDELQIGAEFVSDYTHNRSCQSFG